MSAPFEFSWKACPQCGHEVMWARTPGAPDRAAHICEAPRLWVPSGPAVDIEDD